MSEEMEFNALVTFKTMANISKHFLDHQTLNFEEFTEILKNSMIETLEDFDRKK